MRIAERLLTKLRYEDALTEADDNNRQRQANFCSKRFRLSRSLLQAFSENHEEEVEEEVVYEWKNLDEFSVELSF